MWWFFKRPLPDPGDPNVLFLRPYTGFGDHLMLSAAMEGIHAARPEIRFRILAQHPELFEHNPRVEEALRLKHVKRRDPKWVDRYHVCGHRPPEERIGQTSGHLIDDVYDAIRDTTGVDVTCRAREPRIYLTKKELAFQKSRLERLPRPRVAVVTHGKSSVRLPNKIYPPDQWARLSALLAARFPTVIQLGAKQDGPGEPGTIDMRDIGYRHTAAVLRHCDLLVCHVGGIMHLAAALRVPTLVLYGAAEHPEISGYPWNRNLFTPIDCGPCWSREPCPHLSCMRHLTPELVLREAEAALQNLSEGRSASHGFTHVPGAALLPALATL